MLFYRYLFLILSFVVFLAFFIYQNISIEKTTIYKSKLPLIVFCTDLYKTKFLNNEILSFMKNCPLQCEISDNILFYPFADIAIFHSRDMIINKSFISKTNPNRLNVFYAQEAYPHELIRRKRFPKNFFNITMTFRRDSNIWKPYDRFENILPYEAANTDLIWNSKQISKIIAQKSKHVLQFVSHCSTHSLRELYIDQIQKYVNISSFGRCYGDKKHDETKLIKEHFFYFAFENAVCKDYVTEKFWRLKQLIVPIVLKRSILKGIVNDKYFIAIDDFKSPKDLADKLISLSKNLSEYQKYFSWTSKYKKIPAYKNPSNFGQREICRLCEMAHKKEKHQIEDIYHWWEKGSECQLNYFNSSLQNLKRPILV